MKKDVFNAVQRVHQAFKVNGLTLSTAESCTGGSISHYLTALPGASAFFRGGVVAYSGELKLIIPGISPDTIQRHGAVSDETAREMAEKIRLLAKTDYSLSTTGILGPDVIEGKEKGLVFAAASRDNKTISRELRLTGDRDENREEASLASMNLLLELVQG
jgi:PncC family amidohydrolase